jgi:hypothetical protein
MVLLFELKVINSEIQPTISIVFIFMEINIRQKMNRRFRIVYYSLMAVLLLIFSYNVFLFVSIVFEMPDMGVSILRLPWE